MTIGHKIFGGGPEGVIVLHGWFSDHTVFDPMMPWLDTDACTYAFMDCRGYGLSKDQDGTHSMDEFGGDALALADHLGWSKFHVVGHSMGGMAAQWVAANAPDRVKSVVGITPVPACGVPMEGDMLALFSGAAENDENRRQILSLTTGDRLGPIWERKAVELSVAVSTRKAFGDYFVAWTQSNFADRMEGLKTPIKVIVGENDPAITPDAMKGTILAWCPNAELEVMTNAGHYPSQETPVRLANVVQSFVSANA